MKKISFKILVLVIGAIEVLNAQTKQIQNPNLQTLGSPVNTIQYSEFAPTISADGKTLIFESDKTGQWRLYTSSQNERGGWSIPEELKVINDLLKPNDFIGGPFLSYDGNALYFCSNMAGTYGGVDIFVSLKVNKQWTKPKNLGKSVNTSLNEGFPSVSPDNNWLYYMREGNGNTKSGQRCCDLYLAQRRGAFFMNAKPLPSPINTGCESSPRILADGRTLVFSSQRAGGKGSFDLYESKYVNKAWSTPIPLAFINTSNDDELIAIPASGDVIYLSSTMNNHKDDIFKIELPKEFQPDKLVLVQGKVIDEESNTSIKAKVVVSDLTKKTKIQEIENNEDGTYSIILEEGKKYDVSVQAQGYSFQSDVFDLEQTPKYANVSKNIKLEKLKENTVFTLNNIFFEFDSYELTSESTLELKRVIDLMNVNPNMLVEISAHTDEKGEDEYNKKLSQKRAESVVLYITQQGISSTRISAKGYGETMPLVANDSDEHRAMNRRVEFKIIKLQ